MAATIASVPPAVGCQELQDAITRLHASIAYGQRTLDNVQQTQKALLGKGASKEQAIEQINSQFKILADHLEQRRLCLLAEVEKLAESKAAQLAQQQQELTGFLSKSRTAVETAKTVLVNDALPASDFQSHQRTLVELSNTRLFPAPVVAPTITTTFSAALAPAIQSFGGLVDDGAVQQYSVIAEVARLRERFSTSVLIELIEADSPLLDQLPPDFLQVNRLTVGARNALRLLLSSAASPSTDATYSLDGVLELIESVSRWSGHAARLLGLFVDANKGCIPIEGKPTLFEGLLCSLAASNIRNLHLSSAGLDGERLTAIGKALTGNASLTSLQFDFFNTSFAPSEEGIVSLLNGLIPSTTLTSLTLLENINFREATGAPLCKLLSSAAPLSSLDLSYNSMNEAALLQLAHGLKDNVTLTFLNLSDLFFSENGAATTALGEALRVHPALRSLNLSSCNLFDDNIAKIAEAIEEHSTLTSLDLSRNQCADAGLVALSKALRGNNHLTSLSFARNIFCDEGVLALAAALKVNTRLSSLDVSEAAITSSGCTALFEALAANEAKALTKLNLSSTEIGCNPDDFTILGQLLGNDSTLTSLDLSGTWIEDAGCTPIAQALRSNKTLKHLVMANNRIGDQGAYELGQALQENSTLTSVDLQGNNIRDCLYDARASW